MPADRIRDHVGRGATTVAVHRRRLRADQARQLADLLRHQILTGGYPDGSLPHETTLGTDYRASRNTVRQALDAAPVASLPAATDVPEATTSNHPDAGDNSSPRLLELLALSEEEPELAALRPYLNDPSPAVRRATVAVLTETMPPGTGPALAAALRDPRPATRTATYGPPPQPRCASWSRRCRPSPTCATTSPPSSPRTIPSCAPPPWTSCGRCASATRHCSRTPSPTPPPPSGSRPYAPSSRSMPRSPWPGRRPTPPARSASPSPERWPA